MNERVADLHTFALWPGIDMDMDTDTDMDTDITKSREKNSKSNIYITYTIPN